MDRLSPHRGVDERVAILPLAALVWIEVRNDGQFQTEHLSGVIHAGHSSPPSTGCERLSWSAASPRGAPPCRRFPKSSCFIGLARPLEQGCLQPFRETNGWPPGKAAVKPRVNAESRARQSLFSFCPEHAAHGNTRLLKELPSLRRSRLAAEPSGDTSKKRRSSDAFAASFGRANTHLWTDVDQAGGCDGGSPLLIGGPLRARFRADLQPAAA